MDSRSKMIVSVIGRAEIAAILIYYILIRLLIFQGFPSRTMPAEISRLLFIVFGAISVSLFPILLALQGKLRNILESQGFNKQRAIQISIVILSICQSPAIFGFVLFLLTGATTYFYILAIVSLIFYAIFWPKLEINY